MPRKKKVDGVDNKCCGRVDIVRVAFDRRHAHAASRWMVPIEAKAKKSQGRNPTNRSMRTTGPNLGCMYLLSFVQTLVRQSVCVPQGSRMERDVATQDVDAADASQPPLKRTRYGAAVTFAHSATHADRLPAEMVCECMEHMDMPTLVAFSSTDRMRRALYLSMFRFPAFASRLGHYIGTCAPDALVRFGKSFARA